MPRFTLEKPTHHSSLQLEVDGSPQDIVEMFVDLLSNNANIAALFKEIIVETNNRKAGLAAKDYSPNNPPLRELKKLKIPNGTEDEDTINSFLDTIPRNKGIKDAENS